MLIVAEISDHLPVYAICGNQFAGRSLIPSQYSIIIKTNTIDKLSYLAMYVDLVLLINL